MVKVNNKSSKSDHLRAKKKVKKVLNPFEVHVNKEKIKVLGRKSKNDRGLPGIARAKAITKRKNTIGHEYIRRHKSNKFVDNRIGERNTAMTAEDRITARFAAEQRKLHRNKHSIYNLEDTMLTHKGQTLQEIEKFDDPRSDDEFSDDDQKKKGKLEGSFVAEAHFGGGMFKSTGEEGAKSRKDLIEQLIMESKKRKLEKQREREATIEMTEKLDSEWKDLLPLVNKNKGSKIQEPIEKAKDDYDMVVKQLKFEARGMPTDRLKTEDEIAKENKEKLEQLEQDRLARMNSGATNKVVQSKHRSADDLDDGLYIESETDFTVSYDKDGNLINKPEILEENDNVTTNQEDNSDVESDEDVEHEDDESESDVDSLNDLKVDSSDENDEVDDNKLDEDQEMDDDLEMDKGQEMNEIDKNKNLHEHENDKKITSEEEPKSVADNNNKDQKNKAHEESSNMKNTEDTKAKNIKSDLLKRKIIMDKAAAELPYTFKTPSNYEELENLLIKHPPIHQGIIIERMIKCNHPSLSEGNKEKLDTLLAYLIQYINDLFLNIDESIKNNFLTLNQLTPYIYDLCQMNPANAYTCFMEVLKEKQQDFRKCKSSYPGLDTLIFFKLVSVLFPTSDYRHQVVTPALTFMSQILTRCKVKTKTDIVSGLFLVTLLLEYTVLSKRYMPAALIFIGGILHMSISKRSIQVIKALLPFKSHGNLSTLLVVDEMVKKSTELGQDTRLTSLDFIDGIIDNSFKIRVFYTSLKLLHEFCDNLSPLSASDMIFEYHMKLLQHVNIDNYHNIIKKQYEATYDSLNKLREHVKDYIQLEKARPKALRLYEPNIEKIIYDGKQHRPMSKEKAEHEKLLHKYKKEMKGALREIRRDKSYIANMQLKRQLASDAERKEKVKRLYAEAALQQGELNALKRKK
uniref:Putative nucleolar protein n=1 Tax=Xenopsylla cheopis TaxID=163159 RepID=A0A6M2DRW4_XENCH